MCHRILSEYLFSQQLPGPCLTDEGGEPEPMLFLLGMSITLVYGLLFI